MMDPAQAVLVVSFLFVAAVFGLAALVDFLWRR